MRTALLTDAHDFAQVSESLSELRRASLADGNIFFDPNYFLTAADKVRRPCAVACWQKDRLAGILFAVQQYVCGFPTGYAVAGDYSGRGALLALPDDRAAVAQAAIAALTRHGIHSLHLRLSPALESHPELEGFAFQHLRDTVPGDHLRLAPTYEDFLGSLGKHTRRNIRHYTRRAQEVGFSFSSDVPVSEYVTGVRALNRLTAFPITERRIARDLRLVQRFGGGHFALRNAAGEIIAALCGFSQNNCFYLLSQVNHAGMAHHSLSIVLRGHTIEHLIAAGHTDLQFMGGTSLTLGRFCEPIDFEALVLDNPRSAFTPLKQLAASAVASRASRRKTSPVSVEIFAGSFLGTDHIIDRTPLRPALALRQKALAGQKEIMPPPEPQPNTKMPSAAAAALHPEPLPNVFRRGA